MNVIAYRLIKNHSVISPRSFCPQCKQRLAWYDLIPVLSWITLCGHCRYCHQPISWLYPFIELLTAVVMTALVLLVPFSFVPAYFIFFSALIVTVRTDSETMLISRFAGIFLVPLGLAFSLFNAIPITPFNSLLGTIVGYSAPYLFSKIFLLITGKEGIGGGDFELLAMIGSFTGLIGCWTSLVGGALLGSLFGFIKLISGKADRSTRIPFGPFLAFAAIIFVLFQEHIVKVFLL